MPFTAAETIAFFEGAAQMAIPQSTRLRLQVEGLASVDDLLEFDEETLKQLTENLRKHGGFVQNPNVAVGQPQQLIPTPAFVIGAKSLKRLKAAMYIVKYYETVGRATVPLNMRWDPVIKEFIEHWKALQDGKDGEVPEVPKVSAKGLQDLDGDEVF